MWEEYRKAVSVTHVGRRKDRLCQAVPQDQHAGNCKPLSESNFIKDRTIGQKNILRLVVLFQIPNSQRPKGCCSLQELNEGGGI